METIKPLEKDEEIISYKVVYKFDKLTHEIYNYFMYQFFHKYT